MLQIRVNASASGKQLFDAQVFDCVQRYRNACARLFTVRLMPEVVLAAEYSFPENSKFGDPAEQAIS